MQRKPSIATDNNYHHDGSHVQPFAAVLDHAEEQMVVAVTVAMPSARRRLTGKLGGDENDQSLGEDREDVQHHIGLVRIHCLH